MKICNYRDLLDASMRRYFSPGKETGTLFRYLDGWETIEAGSEFAAGDLTLSPRLLLDGWAAEQVILSDGRRQILRFVVPGDMILSTRGTRGTSLAALTRLIYARPLSNMAAEASAVAQLANLTATITEARLRDQVVRLGCLSGTERAAHLLLELYTRLERAGLAEGGRFSLPVSQEVLADALGLSVVHTNRVLQTLRNEGLLETRKAGYFLPNLEGLNQRAGYAQSAFEGAVAVTPSAAATLERVAPPPP